MHSKSSNLTLEETRLSLNPSTKSRYMLLTAFASAKRELDYLSKNQPRFSMTPSKPHSQQIFAVNKMKHNDRLLKFKAEERKKEIKAFQQYKQQIRITQEGNRNDYRSLSSSMISSKFSQAKYYKQRIEKLEEEFSHSVQEKINEKMERSSVNYSSNLQKKKEVTSMLRSRAHSVNRAYESPEDREKDAILKIIAKREDTEKRKNRFLNELHERLRRSHDKKEKKMASAKENIVKKEKLLMKRSMDIEKRLKTYQSLIINQKQDISNKIKLKLGKERMKEDTAMKIHEKKKLLE